MDVIVVPVLEILYHVLRLYIWVIVAGVIMSWLVVLNVVNPYNSVVRAINEVIARLTEPLLRPIRRILPDMGPVDLSPLVLILLVWLSQRMIIQLLIKFSQTSPAV